jgi:hypothetical protein
LSSCTIRSLSRRARIHDCPVPLCPPQIPHDVNRFRTRAAAVGCQRLAARAKTLSIQCQLFLCRNKGINPKSTYWSTLYFWNNTQCADSAMHRLVTLGSLLILPVDGTVHDILSAVRPRQLHLTCLHKVASANLIKIFRGFPSSKSKCCVGTYIPRCTACFPCSPPNGNFKISP